MKTNDKLRLAADMNPTKKVHKCLFLICAIRFPNKLFRFPYISVI